MSSHDIRISVEHYEDGGFGVIGEHYQQMGISKLHELPYEVEEIMLKELGWLKLKENEDERRKKS